MPRTKKSDKFFYHHLRKTGKRKNKVLIGANCDYCDFDNLTLDDLVVYLKENNIPLDSINVSNMNFISETS